MARTVTDLEQRIQVCAVLLRPSHCGAALTHLLLRACKARSWHT